MAKLTEKQLFGTWLDIWVSEGLLIDYVTDLESTLKDARQSKRKAARLLKKAEDHYSSVVGKKPESPKQFRR